MKAVIQRVKEASVTADGRVTGVIDKGFVILLGITHEDSSADAEYLARKVANLRIFEDEDQKMNLSIKEIKGSVLSISQFTLYGDTRKGRRPNFMAAAPPKKAEKLYDEFNVLLKAEEIDVETGVFGAMMDVKLINDGPVTLIVDSADRNKS